MIPIENIKQLLLPVFEKYRAKVVFVYLFGSVAIGEASPLSDVDIAVYLTEENRDSFFDLKLALHADISRALKRNDADLVVLNTIRNEMLTADVIRNGIVIFGRDTKAREDYEIKRLHESIDFKTHRFCRYGYLMERILHKKYPRSQSVKAFCRSWKRSKSSCGK